MKCHRALAGTHPGDLDVQRDSGRWPAIRSITGPKSCDWLLGGVDLGTKEREAQRSQHQDGRSPTGWDRQGNPWWGGGEEGVGSLFLLSTTRKSTRAGISITANLHGVDML